MHLSQLRRASASVTCDATSQMQAPTRLTLRSPRHSICIPPASCEHPCSRLCGAVPPTGRHDSATERGHDDDQVRTPGPGAQGPSQSSRRYLSHATTSTCRGTLQSRGERFPDGASAAGVTLRRASVAPRGRVRAGGQVRRCAVRLWRQGLTNHAKHLVVMGASHKFGRHPNTGSRSSEK